MEPAPDDEVGVFDDDGEAEGLGAVDDERIMDMFGGEDWRCMEVAPAYNCG